MNPVSQLIRQLSGIVQGGDKHNPAGAAFIKEAEKAAKEKMDLDIPLRSLSATVFDLETTGFFPQKQDRILSIGGVKIKNNEITDDTFYSFVNYDQPISETIRHLTGIQEEDVLNAPAEADVLTRFFAFAEDDLFIAHHAAHEKGFMQDALWRSFRATFQRRLIDTIFLTKLQPDLRDTAELEACCRYFSIEPTGRHHALHDAMLAAELWIHSVNVMESTGIHTLKDVYRALSR